MANCRLALTESCPNQADKGALSHGFTDVKNLTQVKFSTDTSQSDKGFEINSVRTLRRCPKIYPLIANKEPTVSARQCPNLKSWLQQLLASCLSASYSNPTQSCDNKPEGVQSVS